MTAGGTPFENSSVERKQCNSIYAASKGESRLSFPLRPSKNADNIMKPWPILITWWFLVEVHFQTPLSLSAPFASSFRVLLSTRPVLSIFVFQLVHLRLKGLPLFFHRLRHCLFQVSIKQLRQAQRRRMRSLSSLSRLLIFAEPTWILLRKLLPWQ